MNTMKNHLILWSFLMYIILIACQEDEENLLDEPKVKMILMNQDSLVQVNDTLQQISDSLSVLNDTLVYFRDSADVLQDTVLVLQDLIDAGQTQYQTAHDQLKGQLIFFQTEYNQFNQYDSILSVSRTGWIGVASKITNGNALISSITNVQNGNSVYYEDSATLWRLPLSNNLDSVSLVLVIADESYDLDVTYQRDIMVDERNNVVFQASDIEVSSAKFDSVTWNCKNEDCIDYETTARLYF
jgi:hypothetical protein